MRRSCLLGALAILAACGGGTEPTNKGPLTLGIVSGNNQTAAAGDTSLLQPVVGRLVRSPSGQVSWVPEPVQSAGRRLLDFAVPRAFAQGGTVVNGSPVVGAVVCAVSITTGGMTPFSPCTNTDNDGKATFFFTPGTKAGEQLAEIRGTVENQPTVFDTAKATVTAGTVDTVVYKLLTKSIDVYIGDRFALRDNILHLADAYGNNVTIAPTIISAAGMSIAGDTITPGNAEAVSTVVIDIGGYRDTLTVNTRAKLAGKSLDIEGMCQLLGPVRTMAHENGDILDSVTFVGAIDSVVVKSQVFESETWNYFHWTATVTEYRQGGTTGTYVKTSVTPVLTWRPGFFYFGDSSILRNQTTLVSVSPIHLQGGMAFCPTQSGTFLESGPPARLDITEH